MYRNLLNSMTLVTLLAVGPALSANAWAGDEDGPNNGDDSGDVIDGADEEVEGDERVPAAYDDAVGEAAVAVDKAIDESDDLLSTFIKWLAEHFGTDHIPTDDSLAPSSSTPSEDGTLTLEYEVASGDFPATLKAAVSDLENGDLLLEDGDASYYFEKSKTFGGSSYTVWYTVEVEKSLTRGGVTWDVVRTYQGKVVTPKTGSSKVYVKTSI